MFGLVENKKGIRGIDLTVQTVHRIDIPVTGLIQHLSRNDQMCLFVYIKVDLMEVLGFVNGSQFDFNHRFGVHLLLPVLFIYEVLVIEIGEELLW